MVKNRPYYTATPTNRVSSSPQDDHYDLYRTESDETGNTNGDGVEGEEEEEDVEGIDGDAFSRYVSITNPTRTTANSYMKQVPNGGQGRQPPAMPPHFIGPELIPNATTVPLPTLVRPITVTLLLLILWKIIN